MRRHRASDVAAGRPIPFGRLALGLPLALLLTSGVLGGERALGPRPTAPEFGVERTVAGDAGPQTGNAAVAVNRPPAPVGDPDRAIDSEQVIQLAGPIASAVEPAGLEDHWFLVGDSTFTAAAAHLGGGSAFPGVGFELAPFVGSPNPLRSPDDDFAGTVVIGVSIWDVAIADAEAYVHAVTHYRSLGHPVIVVEVPERFGPGDEVVTTSVEEAGLRSLNRRVAADLGCELAPWTVRDVETSGDVDGGDDHVHPTAGGVAQLLDNLTAIADQTCTPPRPAQLG